MEVLDGVLHVLRTSDSISSATRAAARKQFAGLGHEIVQKMLAKIGKTYVAKEVTAAIPRVGHKDVDDALAAIGRGELSAVDMLKAMGHTIDDTKLKELRRKSPSRKSDPDLSVPVRGVARTTALRISPETGAVPGERIVGILTPGDIVGIGGWVSLGNAGNMKNDIGVAISDRCHATFGHNSVGFTK